MSHNKPDQLDISLHSQAAKFRRDGLTSNGIYVLLRSNPTNFILSENEIKVVIQRVFDR